MINGSLTHPDVLNALARLGHTSKVLIADAHFPAPMLIAPATPVVRLNYAPGLISVPDALRPLVAAVAIQDAVAAVLEDGTEPPVWEDYRSILPANVEVQPVLGSRLTSAFSEQDLGLVILTGDLRPASCIVLTLGLREA